MVGLTGGIGAGKSTVAALLRDLGIAIIGTDELGHEAIRAGGAAHQSVVTRFGPGVVGPDGGIDRAALAEVVFADERSRADLNAIVHPFVARAVDERLAQLARAGAELVVLEVPLLVEAGWRDRVDKVIVVDAPEDVVLGRLVGDRGMDEAAVRRRMQAQASRAERLAAADIVIDNSGSIDDLAHEVARAWQELASLLSRP